MELRDIEYFEEIAEQRHLGRAAERLGLSQPALSKSLRRLEEAMQVKLFNRNAKGLELTAEGSLLLARARDLRLSLRNVAREVSDVSEGRAGHLRIGVGPSIPTRLISSSLAKLLIDAPRIAARVTISDADEIIPALRKGELDLNVNVMHASPPEGPLLRSALRRGFRGLRRPKTIGCPANRKSASRTCATRAGHCRSRCFRRSRSYALCLRNTACRGRKWHWNPAHWRCGCRRSCLPTCSPTRRVG